MFALQVKEMGEDGRGSLDPGIASGLEFVVCYPNKFLEFYYAENPSELPGSSASCPDAGVPEDPSGASECGDEVSNEKRMKLEKDKAPVLRYLKLEDCQPCKAGARYGEFTNIYS